MGIVALVYTVIAIYAGFRFVDGRIAWLEVNAPLNKIVKLGVSILAGYVIGAFYLIYLIIRFVFSFVS